MTLSRITVVTLGVGNLAKSSAFYEAVFGIRPNAKYEGVSFFELPGTWLTLYPLDKLAEDISPEVPRSRSGFSGYFADHDGYYWEVVWGPIFEHAPDGSLCFRD